MSARIGTKPDGTQCAGHANADGLRLYYDSAEARSRFDLTLEPNPGTDEYLHSDGGPCSRAESAGVTTRFLDPSAPGSAAAKCKGSSSVGFTGGNPWKEIGTWSMTVP